MGYTLLIIGTGVMGQAVLSSIYKAPHVADAERRSLYPSEIVTVNHSDQGSEKVKKLVQTLGESPNGIKVACKTGSDWLNAESNFHADVIVLGTKPYQLEGVFKEYRDLFHGHVISLAAGWDIARLEECGTKSVSRVMTNTPAKFGCGSAVISHSVATTEYQRRRAQELFQHLGLCVELPEKNMNAATSLVGSGPAFVLLWIEALMEGGIKMGIPQEESKRLATNVVEGTAQMLTATGSHPSVLKHQVCTPGGTTIAGLVEMEDRGVKSGIVKGLEEAANVAAELGKK